MLTLLRRAPEYVAGYREYCQEFYDHNIVYFRPTNPNLIDDDWFERTKEWCGKKEAGLIPGKATSIHYWAVDDGKFIGEFQLRIELTEEVMKGIGSVGYAVKVSEQGKGYGQEILRQGFKLSKQHGMSKVLLNINSSNAASIHVCEKMGGVLMDTIEAYNEDEGQYLMRRYWIYLEK